METWRMAGLVLAAMQAGVSAPGLAQPAGVVIEQSVSPRTPLPVAPGSTTDWTLVVRNDGATAIPRVSIRLVSSTPVQLGAWTFGPSSSPQCGDVGPDPLTPTWRSLHVDGLAAGERRVCVYPLTRPASSRVDLVLAASLIDPVSPGVGATWVAGTLADVALTVSPTCDGDPASDVQHVRVSVRNQGGTALGELPVGGCFALTPPAFTLDGDIPGGCGRVSGAQLPCVVGSLGWLMPATQPGEAQSCLLALTPRDSLVRDVRVRVVSTPDLAGGLLELINPDTAQSVLALQDPAPICRGTAAPQPVPGTDRYGLLLLILALLAVTGLAYRANVAR